MSLEKEVKILTISAGDYAKSQGKFLEDYEMGFVGAEDNDLFGMLLEINLKEEAASKGYEAVVDVRKELHDEFLKEYYLMYGTGMKLKE